MTAVEWLVDQILNNKGARVISTSTFYIKDEVVEQAKAMDKEQKIKFAEHCLDKALDLDIRTAFANVEQYYNEKFKSE